MARIVSCHALGSYVPILYMITCPRGPRVARVRRAVRDMLGGATRGGSLRYSIVQGCDLPHLIEVMHSLHILLAYLCYGLVFYSLENGLYLRWLGSLWVRRRWTSGRKGADADHTLCC